jgi:Protein of unknown function (DUF669)
MARAARRKTTISVDFEGVDLEGGGGSFHIPEGDYRMKVISAEKGTSKNDNEQIEWKFEGLEGKAKGKKFYFYTTLTPESLWKLGQTLEALGLQVPDSSMDIDLEELIDLECIGVVEDDEYQGKVKSKLQSVTAVEEEETPARGKDKPGKGKPSKKAQKIDESEVKAMAEDELAELIEKHELDVELRSHKTLRRKADAVIEALKENDLLEE